MSKPRRIKITHFHKEDACYPSATRWVGQTGTFEPTPPHYCPGYYAGFFYPDSGKPLKKAYFLGIRYRRI